MTFPARAALAAAFALPLLAQAPAPLRGYPAARIAEQHALEAKARALPDPVRARRYLEAMAADPHLRQGLNVHEGALTYQAVATDLGLPYRKTEDALGL